MAITNQDLTTNQTVLKYLVGYEAVEAGFGAAVGDTFNKSFDFYDLEAFGRAAPKGWEIRTIEQYEVPDA